MIAPAGDLTLPRESTATLRRVLGEVLRYRVRLLGRLERTSAPARALVAAIKSELTREPGPVWSALRRPTVGALLSCWASGAADLDALATELVATLAVELALAGAKLPDLDLPRTPARVLGLGARIALPGGGPARLRGMRWEHAGASIALREAPSPYAAIDREIALALADNNPLAMLEAHPDKAGNAIDLGGHGADEWCAELRAALAVVEEHLPLVREEMDLALHQIVPVGYDAEKHLSASYREAIGTIYLTLHPDRMTMVEALIHEFQHNKLNAVLELDPILEDAYEAKFVSPVRPDPRPLLGILLAVHAFAPVAELYRRREKNGDPQGRLRERREAIERGNREGLAVLLEHAHPTDVGRALLAELERIV